MPHGSSQYNSAPVTKHLSENQIVLNYTIWLTRKKRGMVKGVLTMKISLNNQYAPEQLLHNRFLEKIHFFMSQMATHISALKTFIPELEWLRWLKPTLCYILK